MRDRHNLHMRGDGNLHMQGDKDPTHTWELIKPHICKEGGGRVRTQDLPMRIGAPYYQGKKPFKN